MKRSKEWQKFEDYIAEEVRDIAPYATPTKGSRYGDLKNVPGLHIEAKCYENINVYQEKWMQKCISEVPFHSDKVPILVTKNKNNDIRVHMSWFDFKELYFEFHKMKSGEKHV